jgi:serine/threonine protein phosphatase PrpC
MGGHAAGEVASKLAVDVITEFFRKSAGGEITWPFKIDPERPLVENRLACAIKLASHHIFLEARGDMKRRGMGTTVVAAAVEHGRIHIAHVGDSRCYRIRAGDVERLTLDHTMLEEFKRYNPDMTPEEEKRFAHRSVLSRALGFARRRSRSICSGTSSCRATGSSSVPTGSPARSTTGACWRRWPAPATISRPPPPSSSHRANRDGGTDNVTVILLSWA